MMPFDPVMADEYRHNSGETVADWLDREYGDRLPYFRAELARIPAFVTKAVANAEGADLDRIIAGIADKDDAEVGAAVRELVTAKAREALDDVMRGIGNSENPDELLKWWRA